MPVTLGGGVDPIDARDIRGSTQLMPVTLGGGGQPH